MTTGGYSGTPLQQKLGMKPGHRVAFVSGPPGFADRAGARPGVAS